jgi:hypothetical protein
MADPAQTMDHIEDLVAEEHRLWGESSAGRLDDAGHARLGEINRELDRCWDVLRRRRANPEVSDHLRDSDVPDPSNELEGGTEPHHLDHGVHGADEPDPDPGVNPNVP